MNIKLSDLGAAPTSVVGTYRDVQSAGQVGRAAAQLADTVGQLAGTIQQKKRQQDTAYAEQRLQDVSDAYSDALKNNSVNDVMSKDPNAQIIAVNEVVFGDAKKLTDELKGLNLSNSDKKIFNMRLAKLGTRAVDAANLSADMFVSDAKTKVVYDGKLRKAQRGEYTEADKEDLMKGIGNKTPEEIESMHKDLTYTNTVSTYQNDITASKEDPQELVALSADIRSDKTLTANDKAALYNRASAGIKTAYQEAYANSTFDVGQLASSLNTSEQKAALANQLRSISESLPSAKTPEERLAIVKEQMPDMSEDFQREVAEMHPKDVAHWATSIRVGADALAKAEAKAGAKAPVVGFTDDMFNALKQDVLSGTRSDQDTLVFGAKGQIGPDGKHYILSEAQEAELAPVFQQAHQNAMFQAYAGRSNKLMKPVLQFLSPDFQKGEYLMDPGRFEQFYNALQTLKASNNVGQATVRNLMGYAIDQMSKGTATDLQGRGFFGIGNGVDPEKSQAIGRALSVIQEKMPHMADFDVSKDVEQAMDGIDKIWDAGGKDRDKNIDAYIETLKSTTAQQMVSGSLQNTINGIPND